MPTYEYKCNECEEIFEVFQKITDVPLKRCRVCGGTLIRLISGGVGIIFKGSGFYSTDYKRTPHKTESQKKSESTPGESTSAEKKEETSKRNFQREKR